MSLTADQARCEARELPAMTAQQLADLALAADRLARQFETSGNVFSASARLSADAIADEAARRSTLSI